MTKTIKNIITVIAVILSLLAIFSKTAKAQSADQLLEEALNAYDMKHLGTDYYAYTSTYWFNDAMFNGGTSDFTKRMVYQYVIDQASVFSELTKTHDLEFQGANSTILMEDYLAYCAIFSFLVPKETENISEFEDLIDKWVSVAEFLNILFLQDEYFSDVDVNTQTLVSFWFEAAQAQLLTIKAKVYNKTLSQDEEFFIIDLAERLQDYYKESYIESIHLFNTVVKNVKKINESTTKIRHGRKFAYKEISIYYFK